MQREEIFEIWAPTSGRWSLWVRPVLFAHLPQNPSPAQPATPPTGEALAWAPTPSEGFALMVDLPGAEAVELGLALAQVGWRPIPLFNACTALHEVLPQQEILQALQAGTPILEACPLPADAPPAFLLDARRMNPPLPLAYGAFDNRWNVFPQDLPSAEILQSHGISRILLILNRSSSPQRDLADVLFHWHEAGLLLEVVDVQDGVRSQLTLAPPSRIRRAWNRLLEKLGLRRAPKDGFGATIPRPSRG